jgi:hypothetical protein
MDGVDTYPLELWARKPLVGIYRSWIVVEKLWNTSYGVELMRKTRPQDLAS